MDEFVARIITHKLFVGLKIGLLLSIQGAFLVEKSLELWQIAALIAGVGGIAALVRPVCQNALRRHSRIVVFQLSQVLLILSILLALPAVGFLPLAAAGALLGVSQALAVGTIAVWILDQLERRARLDQVQEIIPIFNGALVTGMMVGAVCGGYMPSLLPMPAGLASTSADLLVIAGLAALHLILSPRLFREGDRQTNRRRPQTHHSDESTPARDDLRVWLHRPANLSLLALAIAGGASLAAMEALWQPRLLQLLPDPDDMSVLGFATAALLCAAMGGPLLGRWLERVTPAKAPAMLALSGAGVAVFLWLASLQETVFNYLAMTVGVVFFIALAAPVGLSVLRDQTAAPLRPFAIRLYTRAIIAGMLLAGTVGAGLVHFWGLGAVWQTLGTSVAVTALAMIALGARNGLRVGDPVRR